MPRLAKRTTEVCKVNVLERQVDREASSEQQIGSMSFCLCTAHEAVKMSLAPPYTLETAHQKVKKAQELWNTRYDDDLIRRLRGFR